MFNFTILGQNLNDLSFGTDSTFEIITWNIEWFPKNGTITIDSVSKIIESLDADLYALQEIGDTTVCRQMIDGLSEYGLYVDDGWFGGLAYVYKTDNIVDPLFYKIYDTPTFWNALPRSPLVIEFVFMDESYVVINNHFKCCGDGVLNISNSSDEETRRYEANDLIKDYIDINFPFSNVIFTGDLNDNLVDDPANNVFQMFLDKPESYVFTDLGIAGGAISNWSYPAWPSHLDHIMVTDELFDELANENSEVRTIRVDDFMSGGFSEYDLNISDHRPVGLKLEMTSLPMGISEPIFSDIIIYPNPTSSNFSIVSTNENPVSSISVTRLDGQLVHMYTNLQNKQNLNFDLQESPGIYILKVEAAQSKTSHLLRIE